MKNTILKIEPQSITEQVAEFKKKFGINKIIAFSGGADEEKEKELEKIVIDAIKKLKRCRVAILSGATKFGIPNSAVKIAKDNKIHVIGIIPTTGIKHALPTDDFSLHITVHPSYSESFWGDESSIFSKLADAMIVIGGGAGTLIEVSHVMKINEKLIKPDSSRMPIFVAPVLGISGVSEIIYYLPIKENVRQRVLPIDKKIYNGNDASEFIIKKLNLNSLPFNLSNSNDLKPERKVIDSKINSKIDPLDGFKDMLPKTALIKENIIEIFRSELKIFGFLPLETPHIEPSGVFHNILNPQKSDELYRFIDRFHNDVSLRYDHTIPLARVVSMNDPNIIFPFKRYTVGSVFRNGQKHNNKNLNEFTQFDFDIIDANSTISDAEILKVIYNCFKELNIPNFTISINNRKILEGFIQHLELEKKYVEIIHLLEYSKILGLNILEIKLIDELQIEKKDAEKICEFISISNLRSNYDIKIAEYKKFDNKLINEGLRYLDELCILLDNYNVDTSNYCIDFSTLRQFDYYTGIVFDVVVSKISDNASLCYGGRYDNLTAKFSSEMLPGIGASIDINNLIEIIQYLEINIYSNSKTKIFVSLVEGQDITKMIALANTLRNKYIVDIYPSKANHEKQIEFAHLNDYDLAIFYNKDSGVYYLNDLENENSKETKDSFQLVKMIEDLIINNA